MVKLRRNERGAFAVALAGVLPLLVGMVGVGTEFGLWFGDRRALQTAADAAVVGAAWEIYSKHPEEIPEAAQVDSLRNGVSVAAGATLTVNHPPLTGPYAGAGDAVEVVLSRPQQLLFSSLFLPSLSLSARAVAISSPKGPCVLGLNTSGTGVEISGGSLLSTVGCGVASNSTGKDSIKLSGGSDIEADLVYAAGGINLSGGSTITADEVTKNAVEALADPFASLQVPAYGACDHTKFTTSGTTTINPGVYCEGLTLSGSAQVTANPGVYIIQGGVFNVGSQSRLTGDGVTFILTGIPGKVYAEINFSSGSVIRLTAPTTGTYSGLIIFQDRNAATGPTNSFNGGTANQFTGAIYIPRQIVTFTGSSSVTNGCTWLVARVIKLTGNSVFENKCRSAGLPLMGQTPLLVE